MMHLRSVSRTLPAKGVELPDNHTLQFILDNLPTSVYDIIKLVIVHIKNWPDE